MLIGSYLGILGDKRRVAIPKKFLADLGNGFILAKWYEDCLVIVGLEVWDRLLSRLTRGSKVVSLGVRDIERFILGSAFEVTPDSQGRILIPEILVDYAGFKKDLIFFGLGDRLEIWAKEVWDEKAKVIAQSTKEYIEELAKDDK